MIPESSTVVYRVIPEQFRGPDFAIRGNLIFKKDADGNLLRGAVGQLEKATELDLTGKSAARLFGGDAAFNRLSQFGNIASIVGDVASVINLGVCVAGFIHVSRSLKQVERRLGNVERSLERVEGMAGIIDQKVDQLLHLNDLQLHALSDIGELIKSYKVAEVHGALETLQFRLQNTDASEAGYDVREAIKTLQEYRIWLSDRRQDTDVPLPVRTEILRAEVLVILAESRARCFVGDEIYAVSCLERSLESIREDLQKAWEDVIETHGTHALFFHDNMEDEDWLAIFSWLNRKDSREAAYDLLSQMARQRIQEEAEVNFMRMEKSFFEIKVMSTINEAWLNETTVDGVVDRFRKIIDSQDDNLTGDVESLNKEDEAADVASLALCYRLARSVEAALAACAAMEVIGDPVRQLLWAKEEPDSPAIVLEIREPVEAG